MVIKIAEKIKIYLCDFVYNFLKAGTHMFPLNVGYIGAFAKKNFPDIEIKLFKYPDDFIRKCKEDPPHIAGFGNYTWNTYLNRGISDWVKSISPKTIVIFGGPNINYSQKGYKQFFDSYHSTDFYVLYQGETPFVNLLKKIFDKNMDLAVVKEEPLDGVVFNRGGEIICGKISKRIKNLDEIPSPYLSGMLDEFFEQRLIPIVETNRGCPYTCTFCAQGFSSYNQIEFFNIERVKQELDYIAGKIKNTNILIFADSNFGILPRDIEIAHHLTHLTNETGYPRKVSMNWAKNQPKILEIAKILKNINLVISLQSLDETVLEKIKRKNIDISIFKNIVETFNKEGGMSGTEIILALPGETKESHIETLRALFNWNVSYLLCYNLLMLDGSELSLQRERGEFQCYTKFRLSDNCFGEFDGRKYFEIEEGIRRTNTMSEEDILYFRPIHWLIQFLWNYRFYYDLLKYIQSLGVNPIDYIIKLIDDIDNSETPESVKDIFRSFKKEARDEWFDSPEQLREYYSHPENFDYLQKGNHGKLNGKYVFRVLLEIRKDFEKYLYDTAIRYSKDCESKKEIVLEILNILSASIIDFNEEWNAAMRDKHLTTKYGLLSWRKSGYNQDIVYEEGKMVLYVPEEQIKALEILFKQYEHVNKNVTLRKASEYMDIKDFFRKVRD